MIDTDPALFDGGRRLPLVEDFYTIQGEGFHAGKPAYFIRLGGCDVGCRWCDAKYTWNPRRYPPVDVQVVIDRALACPARAIVITGGEPLLYPLDILTRTLHDRGLQIFLETSGTHPFSGRFDWVCLSPKRQQPPLDEAFRRAHELKVIVEREDDLQWAEQNAARVGDDCLLYHGVTLGGTGKDKGKRHPTLSNNVMVGSGAKVLGPFTVGDNARIAAGAVVLSAVPEDCTAVGVPAHVVRVAGKIATFADEVDQISVRDPVEEKLNAALSRLEFLEKLMDEQYLKSRREESAGSET